MAGVKSFLLNVAGFTCVTFTTGALAFYGPNYVKLVSLKPLMVLIPEARVFLRRERPLLKSYSAFFPVELACSTKRLLFCR